MLLTIIKQQRAGSPWNRVRLSVCPSVRLSVCPSIHLSICPFVRLSVCPFVRLSVCLSVCPSVRLPAPDHMVYMMANDHLTLTLLAGDPPSPMCKVDTPYASRAFDPPPGVWDLTQMSKNTATKAKNERTGAGTRERTRGGHGAKKQKTRGPEPGHGREPGEDTGPKN